MADATKKGSGKGGPAEVAAFLAESRLLLSDVEALLERRQPAEGPRRVLARTAAASLQGLRGELDEFEARYPDEAGTAAVTADVLATTGATSMLAAQREVAANEPTEAGTSEALGKGLEIGETVFEKIGKWIPEEAWPWKPLVEDIGDVFGLFAKLLKGEERRRIEQKLDSLQKSVNGPGFPPGEIEGPEPDHRPPLRAEVEELEAKIEQFYKLVVGRDVARTPDGVIEPPPSGRAPRPQLRDSLLWVAWELERKLENVFTRLVGGDFPKNAEGDVVVHLRDPAGSIAGGIDELRIKIDTLARLLGKTLYDVEWNVEPDDHGGTRTVARGARPENATPPRSVKDELHDVEAQLDLVIRLLWWIIGWLRRPPYPPPPEPPLPPEPPPILLGDLKRIFVYDEGTFAPTAGTPSKIILVRTGAFDLGGWIDLTDLADGDTVEIELHVRLPGPVRRSYRRKAFTGSADAGLVRLADVVGPGFVMASAVDLTITQTASHAGFVPPLEIAYQIVVESQ